MARSRVQSAEDSELDRGNRVWLSLPRDGQEEIDVFVKRSGMMRGQFLAAALVIGARALDRALNPHQEITPALVEQMERAIEQMQINPEMLTKILASWGQQKK